ncbi:MAG: hypothetical protein IKN84_07405 [Bacteroidales bacterium]|nr:hypothetical protein [Bacteroidales bacterium]
MPFVKNILNYRSLSIVGLEKNTGKTVCLNYILRRLHEMGVPCAVTSIGVDGEQTDAVFGSAKPEITLYEAMQFITSEKHYSQRRLVSCILDVDPRRTSLGRLVTAQVVCSGKILLSGAASTWLLREQIERFRQCGMPLTIVDGALSRLSLASPTVTEAMILATGAAVSPNMNQLISRTRYVCRLIALDEVEPALQQQLTPLSHGLWAIDSDGCIHDLHISSVFLLDKERTNLFEYGTTLFAAGAVSDRLIRHLTAQRNIADIQLIVRDFTKLFVTPEVFNTFRQKGGRIAVLQRSNLLAVCLNPTSPQGYRLNSDEACKSLSDALGLPVYDVMKTTVV